MATPSCSHSCVAAVVCTRNDLPLHELSRPAAIIAARTTLTWIGMVGHITDAPGSSSASPPPPLMRCTTKSGSGTTCMLGVVSQCRSHSASAGSRCHRVRARSDESAAGGDALAHAKNAASASVAGAPAGSCNSAAQCCRAYSSHTSSRCRANRMAAMACGTTKTSAAGDSGRAARTCVAVSPSAGTARNHDTDVRVSGPGLAQHTYVGG